MSAPLGRVWVVTQSDGGRVAAGGLELLAWACGAASLVEAVHWGPDAATVAAVVGRHGASRLLSTGDLGDALPGAPVAAALAARVSAGDRPDAVLFTTTCDQRDVAGRLSARLDQPVLANAVGLSVRTDGRLVTEHDPYGGTAVATACSTAGPPQLVVVRPRSLPPPRGVSGRPAAVVTLAVPDSGRAGSAARVLRRHRDGGSGPGPALDGARVVVAAGRGLGPGNRFAEVEELARLVGGAPAATRAAVDAGWAPAAALVGQSGRTVAPEVYLAFGVSGAAQHLIGMRGARTVIAVDTDPAAPMMAMADLAVVGDAASVLARLLAALSSA